MSKPDLPKRVIRQIESAVTRYERQRIDFYNLAKRVENDLIENQELKKYIHSTKFREKDPQHLRDKLERKAIEARKGRRKSRIAVDSLFASVTDLAGVRLLHINREQLREIDPAIRKVLRFHKYIFLEEPKAFTWDIENRDFYRGLGFRVEINPTFYTSVHYVVQPHWGPLACEIQVRTLAEELWREVSHCVNYPHESRSVACREQLKVLARVSSGCTRLVDSIFSTVREFEGLSQARAADE